MKEIKFRVWDKKKKVMMTFSGEGLCAEYDVLTFGSNSEPDFLYDKEISELMQFTGLKDKNGKEIYEGDIIRKNGYCHTVHWGHSAWGLNRIENGESYSSSFEVDYYNNEKGEVIGNIYENPELLEIKNK